MGLNNDYSDYSALSLNDNNNARDYGYYDYDYDYDYDDKDDLNYDNYNENYDYYYDNEDLFAVGCTTTASQTTTYSPKIALRMLHYCSISYCIQDNQGTSVFGGLNHGILYHTCYDSNLICRTYENTLIDLNFINAEENECFVGWDVDLKAIVIAFKGSDSVQDWQADFSILFADGDCAGCQIETGFNNQYNFAKIYIKNHVKTLTTKYGHTATNVKIYVTGHSLGGALAQVAGYDLVRSGLVATSNIYVYAFGSPRVYNQNMANMYDTIVGHSFRIINGGDPIPGQPPTLIGYQHTKQTIFLANQNTPANSFTVCKNEDDCCPTGWDPTTHTTYFGVPTGCEIQRDPVTFPAPII